MIIWFSVLFILGFIGRLVPATRSKLAKHTDEAGAIWFVQTRSGDSTSFKALPKHKADPVSVALFTGVTGTHGLDFMIRNKKGLHRWLEQRDWLQPNKLLIGERAYDYNHFIVTDSVDQMETFLQDESFKNALMVLLNHGNALRREVFMTKDKIWVRFTSHIGSFQREAYEAVYPALRTLSGLCKDTQSGGDARISKHTQDRGPWTTDKILWFVQGGMHAAGLFSLPLIIIALSKPQMHDFAVQALAACLIVAPIIAMIWLAFLRRKASNATWAYLLRSDFLIYGLASYTSATFFAAYFLIEIIHLQDIHILLL